MEKVFVLGSQIVTRRKRMGNDETVERIVCPWVLQGFSNQPDKRMLTQTQSDFSGKIGKDPIGIHRNPVDLMQVFQFQENNRTDDQFLRIKTVI